KKKTVNHYKAHSEIRILKSPQLKGINKEDINVKNDITLKIIKFVCKFNPKEIYITISQEFEIYISYANNNDNKKKKDNNFQMK
ncbi:hypothetical protein RFI_37407, partial [Reticulomyxa filosa]